jgi:hypothetical protein
MHNVYSPLRARGQATHHDAVVRTVVVVHVALEYVRHVANFTQRRRIVLTGARVPLIC